MEPNHSSGIVLHDGRISIDFRNKVLERRCRITFDMNRQHYVLIDCLESLHELLPAVLTSSSEPFSLLLPGSSKPVRCYIFGSFRQLVIGNDPSAYLTFWVSGGPSIERRSRLSRVEAEIINLDRYQIASEQVIRLSNDEWGFELTPVQSDSEHPADVQNESYGISHRLVLRKSNGKLFQWTQACKCLESLSTFLSFCSERSVAMALTKGYNKAGKMAVQDLRTPRVDPFGKHVRWMDDYHGSAMSEVFPGFMRLMEKEEWREAIRSSIYWYVRGNTNLIGPDGAIVLIQTALERIAWHVLVRVRCSLTDRDFNNLPAAAQLRLVLDASSVPLELPTQLSNLSKAAKGQKGDQEWLDGPQAFVAVRNQIVHPGKTKRVSGSLTFYEALQLGKWYLEMILLRHFEFEGSYACRLNIPMYVGAVELVPWARK